MQIYVINMAVILTKENAYLETYCTIYLKILIIKHRALHILESKRRDHKGIVGHIDVPVSEKE